MTHPVDGAEDAAKILKDAGVPAVFAHTGGNYFTCYVPVGSDETDEYRVADGRHLAIIGDEEAAGDGARYAIYYRADGEADDVPVARNVPEDCLPIVVRRVRDAQVI